MEATMAIQRGWGSKGNPEKAMALLSSSFLVAEFAGCPSAC
jgi:hypothetical protein